MAENKPGYWTTCESCNGGGETFHPGVAVTHTEMHEPWVGPAYCLECSAAVQDWVRWPCSGVKSWTERSAVPTPDGPQKHLPECPCAEIGVPTCICDDSEECGPQCRHNCICDRLRQAEQRGMRSSHRGRTMYAHGYAAGVTACRDAVAATRETHPNVSQKLAIVFKKDALAAIDAIDALMKENP